MIGGVFGMQQRAHQVDNPIIEGVIWKQLLVFFFPILLGTFFQQLYNTADAVIVGQFVGKEALAAVGGSTGTLLNIIVNLFVGLASGTTVVVAQQYGSGEKKAVSDTVHTAICLAFVGGAILAGIGFLMAKQALVAMGTPHDVIDLAVLYLRTSMLGVIPSFIYNVGAGILRATGDTKRPLFFLITACITNISLDILLVVWFKLGVFGVAFATVISQCLSAFLALLVLKKTNRCYQMQWFKLRFHRNALQKIAIIGLPAGLQSNMFAISNLFIQSAMNSFGTNAVAAWTAFLKADGFFWMISGAYGIAITTFAGQNYGAGRIDRVRKSIRVCAMLEFATTVCFSAFSVFFGAKVLGFFTNDADVVSIGLVIIRYLSPYYVLFVLVEVLSGAIRGCGDSLRPMLITGGGVCLFRILWVLFVLPLRNELTTVLISYSISWVLTSILFVFYYKSEVWLKKGR